MWDLVTGGLGLLGGLFGGSQAKASVDLRKFYGSAQDNQRYAEQKYGNVNSDYYTRARQNQMTSLYDMIASSNRQNQAQLSGQGMNASGKMLNVQSKNALAQAGDQANQFTGNLYNQGQGMVMDARQNLTQAYGQGAQMELQASMANAGNQQNMWSGVAEMGGGLLGQAFGRQGGLNSGMAGTGGMMGNSNQSMAGRQGYGQTNYAYDGMNGWKRGNFNG